MEKKLISTGLQFDGDSLSMYIVRNKQTVKIDDHWWRNCVRIEFWHPYGLPLVYKNIFTGVLYIGNMELCFLLNSLLLYTAYGDC